MNLYEKSGYLNFEEIFNKGKTLTFLIGARGIGKTYGAIKFLLDHNISFAYIRRLQSQLDLLKSQDPKLNPFIAINNDTSYNLIFKKVNKQVYGIYNEGEENARGFGLALSTFHNFRSFGAGVDVVLFDEFIADHNERPLKLEADGFFNLLESVNRNRELNGGKPVKVICMANSNDVGTPLLMYLNLVNRALNMQDKGIEEWHNRDISLILPSHSPISEAKKDTFLYRITQGTAFNDMATGNKFIYNDISNVDSRDIKQYRVIGAIGELVVYKHKSAKEYYISTFLTGTPRRVYRTDDIDVKRFQKDFYFLWLAHLKNRIIFEDYKVKVLFEKYFDFRKK